MAEVWWFDGVCTGGGGEIAVEEAIYYQGGEIGICYELHLFL